MNFIQDFLMMMNIKKEVIEITKSLMPNFGELSEYYKNVSLEEFWKDLKSLFGRPPSSSEGSLVYNIKFDLEEKNIQIYSKDNSVQALEPVINEVLKHNQIQTLTINSRTYDVKHLSNLEPRNAIHYIPEISFCYLVSISRQASIWI